MWTSAVLLLLLPVLVSAVSAGYYDEYDKSDTSPTSPATAMNSITGKSAAKAAWSTRLSTESSEQRQREEQRKEEQRREMKRNLEAHAEEVRREEEQKEEAQLREQREQVENQHYENIRDKINDLENSVERLRERAENNYHDGYYGTTPYGQASWRQVWNLTNQSYVIIGLCGASVFFFLVYFLVQLIRCCRRRNIPTAPRSNGNGTAQACCPGAFSCPGQWPSCAVAINCGGNPVAAEPRAEVSSLPHAKEADKTLLLAPEADSDTLQHL